MCSILAAFDLRARVRTCHRGRGRLALSLSARQRHRGPDWSGVYADDRAVLAHERLAIVDPEQRRAAAPLGATARWRWR